MKRHHLEWLDSQDFTEENTYIQKPCFPWNKPETWTYRTFDIEKFMVYLHQLEDRISKLESKNGSG